MHGVRSTSFALLFLIIFSPIISAATTKQQRPTTDQATQTTATVKATTTPTAITPAQFVFSSTAFKNNGNIPKKYTCDGANASPPLIWANPPKGTTSFALILVDADAPLGKWVHWVMYNIPSNVRGLPANLRRAPKGSAFGENSWDRVGYDGPCPARGSHRYYFTLYALNTRLLLNRDASSEQLLYNMQGRILAKLTVMGRYQSQK